MQKLTSSIALLIALFYFSLGAIQAQSPYQLELELTGGKIGTFFSVDPEQSLANPHSRIANLIGGGRLNFQLTQAWYLKAAVSGTSYGLWTDFNGTGFKINIINEGLVQCDVGIGYHHYLSKTRLSLFGEAGLAVGFGDGGTSFGQTILTVEEGHLDLAFLKEQEEKQEWLFAVQASLGIRYHFTNGIGLRAQWLMQAGLKTFFDGTYQYSLNGGPVQTGTFRTRGSLLGLQFGISYPISRIWEGKKELGAP